MTEKLKIFLLGPPVVRWNDELISIQRQRARALLYYLAWQGKLVPREVVLDLFWEGSAKAGRPRLTETLSRLRGGLPDADLIISRAGQIGLDFERVYVDRLHFETLVNQAGQIPSQIPENEPLPKDTYKLLTQANNLWRDVWALQGVSFPSAELDNWMQQAVERVQCLRFTLLSHLADHAAVMRDFQSALDYARIAQEYEPYNEDIHIRIIQNLAKLGLSDEARAYYEQTRESLHAELGIDPSPRVTRIFEKIYQSDDPTVPDIKPKWELHPSLDVPFMGRKNAMTEIHQIIARGQALIVLGESGQGKSRLIREFIHQINPQPRVLLTICRPLESMQPFQPFVELFRRYVTEDEWKTLSPIWINHLVGLIPELAQIRADLRLFSMLEGVEYSQAMIFESIRQVLLLMNAHHSLFLVIDDAHWADEATLATVAYLLARAPFTQSASLTMVARPEDMTDSFNDMLVSIQQSKLASVYQLRHLQREDIRNLTTYLLKSEPSEQFVNQMISDSGGNTFFVLEILRALVDTDLDVSSSDTSLPSTKNLQNLILMRIQRLHPATKDTLNVAALIGSEFSMEVLEKACLKNPEELVPILEELEKDLLIMPDDQHRGELFYRFSHDKIRETLIQMIPPARARLLHGRIVQTLNKKPQQPAVLAHHYSGAGELITAFRYWIKAAERARALFSKQDALLSYERAEDILQQIETELSTQEIYQFYADWNDLAYNATETNLLKHIGHELSKIGEERGSPLLIGSGLDALSDACMTANNFELGLEYANQAIEYLGKISNCFELVEAFNHRGTFLYMLNRLDEALVSFQNALILSTDIRDSRIYKALSNTHYQIALLEILFGNPVNAYENGVKAFEYAQRGPHTYSIVQAYSIQSLAKIYMGKFSDARETALNGIELAEKIQGWRMLGYLNSYVAISEVGIGYLDSARRHAESAIEIGQKYEQYDIAALGYRALGEIHRMLHDYPGAMNYYQQGFNGLPNHFLGFDNLYRLGLVQHYLAMPNGLENIMMAQNVVNQFSIGIGIITSKLCLALAYAAQGDWQNARLLATELEQETSDRGIGSYHVSAVCLLAEAAIADGKPETALNQLQSVVAEAQLVQNPWGELKVQATLERLLLIQGENPSQPKRRIEALLEHFENQISHPETRKAYYGFQEQISMRSRIVTDPL